MSFAGERSPKRQRLDSYSPASPPLISDTNPFVSPQTPPPSVRMSPSWQAQTNTVLSQHASGTTFPTPPSTAGFQGQMAGRGAGTDAEGESGHQTPVVEDSGILQRNGEVDAGMSDLQDGRDADTAMEHAERGWTDHERRGSERGDVLSAPIRGLYRLTSAPVAPSRPHPSQDLIELYSLQRIQRSVARRDPVTGDKINKLRKSYENKVKALDLPGRNKAQANGGELQGLLDPAWSVAVEGYSTMWDADVANSGKRLLEPMHQQNLFSKLEVALRLQPGRLPPKEHKEWDSMLGLDDTMPPAGERTPAAEATKVTTTVPSAVSRTASAMDTRNAAPASPRNGALRPDRAGKKRRYNDSSFEGYDGYNDEDGYSTGGGDDASRRVSGAKRQRRDFVPSAQNSPSFNNTPGSNGGSMVGVRSS